MKKLIIVMALAALAASVSAQKNSERADGGYESSDFGSDDRMFIWSLGIEPSVPIGNFSKYANFGLGGSLQGEYKPIQTIGITANAGYINYFGKTADGFNYNNFQYWPVMGGLKLYMAGRAYIHGQAGAGFGAKDLGTSFWYGGGIGINITRSIDAELRYMGWKQNEINASETYTGSNGNTGTTGGMGYGGHYSTIGIRLAYGF
jgi:hypothetical protein